MLYCVHEAFEQNYIHLMIIGYSLVNEYSQKIKRFSTYGGVPALSLSLSYFIEAFVVSVIVNLKTFTK